MRQKLVFGHSPQMLTIGVVRMCYLRNVKYLGYKIQSDYDTRTFDMHSKLRHKGINTIHIGVKLLYEHDGTPQGYLTKRFPSLSVNDIEQSSVGKIQQNHMALQMNATFRNVLREVLMGLFIAEPNVKKGKISRRR